MLKYLLTLVSFSLLQILQAQTDYLFIGTYTKTDSKGIYVYKFNIQSGQMELVSTAAAENPSYLTLGRNGRFLYAINENGGADTGSIRAYKFNKTDGTLAFLNSKETGGDHPCYVDANAEGNYLAVANYTGGSLSLIELNKNGSLSGKKQVIQHQGKGPNADRQEKPHVHQTIFNSAGTKLYVNDLGTDEIRIYSVEGKKRKKQLNEQQPVVIKTNPGAGPRHLDFHPTLPVFYSIEELSGKVTAYTQNGTGIKAFQQILSDTISAKPGSADIHVSPNGRFLYASNRNDANNIAIYNIHPQTGALTIAGYQSTMGRIPRNFVIHPSGRWLLVANQTTNNIEVFAISPQTGLLTHSGQSLSIPMPVCLKFLTN